LDLKLRQDLQVQIRKVQREVGITTIYVTHDQGEALSLSDRVAVMKDGSILQLATPEDLYRRPENAFVANFVGRVNLVPVEILDGACNGFRRARLEASEEAEFLVPAQADSVNRELNRRYLLGFRPERASLGFSAPNQLQATVEDLRFFGAVRSVSLISSFGTMLEVDLPSGAQAPGRGEVVRIGWEPDESFLVPSET
jgi:ABC-type Fe3+/spermidine/putrescine transport system ATPase subunit